MKTTSNSSTSTGNDPSQLPFKVSRAADGVCFVVHVQPRASRTEICGLQGDELKVRLTSPPVDDAANRQLAEFIAKSLGLAKSRVTIVAGTKSRHKTVLVTGVEPGLLRTLLPCPP
ncbi:MAG: YggU family protein [Geobacter sp.]|nr:YggU family protein [Geobacter sp.]